ncbi:MAG TPA: amino acid adenylation domain-containing protein, partial [Verrucomicrobiae bacterium]|nr:amino acid adenylation domain-containing protein [Verrucomicrobiae bacterium]
RASYVIYTSGSTGKPKGVVVTHAHVLRLLRAAAPLFAFDARDVWTLFHSPAFDFSVWEMWGAWLSGGRVVIVPHEIARSPESFHDLLARERVTVLNQTPSAFRQLARVDEERQGGDLALRWVVFGGEKLEPSMLRGWCARRGDDRPGLVNMYGITETTVHVTWRRLRVADTRDGTRSRIGRPLSDLRVYVLDAAGRPAPIGVPGEIHVGGAGVARGYLDRAGPTAERFVPDPFTRLPGARMYRSGDRGRWIDGGDLEYLGRLDNQVKVRGFRVECGEIESALAEHPDVRECAVVARDLDGEERRLVAYVVGSGPTGGPDVDELRAHLGARLPEHMIPGAFVRVERLPLTAHGKLDRAALPAPEGTRPALSVPYAPPRGRAEEILGEVWRETLGLDRIGRDDNFFDLGGDSIRSIQVRSRARERGLTVSIPQMFAHQTLKGLAGVAAWVGPSAVLPAGPPRFGLVSAEDRVRLPASAEDAYPLSRLQAGLQYHSERSEDYTVYLNSLHIRARHDARALAEALRRLTERHPMLRTSIDLAGFSEPLQIVHRECEVVLALTDLRSLGQAAQEETLRRFIEGEMRRPFEWSRAPLFRFHVHLRSESSFQLTMSEPFLDGWSVATLLTELFTLYLGGADQPAGDPLRATYRDYVALEREAIASVECRGHWERVLALDERRRLPCPAPAGDAGPPRVLRIDLPIEPGVAEGLKRAAREAGVPIKSVLLAAQMKVLGHLTGARRPVTGLLANGRPETADGEKIIGPFLNLIPFRVDLRGGSWLDLVRRTFDAERDMLPYRRYPMADLKRIAGGADLFDTVFNFTHFHIYRRLHALTGCEVVEATGNENTYFPLTTQANMDEETGALGLAFDFQSAVVDEVFVREAAACFTRTFESIARAPGESHGPVSLLSPLQRATAILESTVIRRSGTAPRRLDEWFAREASLRSDAVAVVFGADRLTYGELERRAGAAASGLRRLGVGRGSFVGLLLDRSADLPVAALAVLQAGAAYVPLDPEYPRERLSWLIEDSRPRVLVAGPGSRHLLPATAAATQVVTLEELSSASAGDAPESSKHPDDAAYVIYTSGSTGVPKGVVVTHANVSSLMESAQPRFGFGEDDVWSLFHSFSFDFSVWEMWGALLHGGRLVIAPHRVSRSPEEFLDLLDRERVTVLNQ